MFQIIPKLSLIEAKREFREVVKKITLRGYLNRPPVSVTGNFKWKLEEGSIKPLSVNEIANIFCPTRREIYMRRVLHKKGKINWGRITGHIVETCIYGSTNKYKSDKTIGRIKNYKTLIRKSSDYIADFSREKKRQIERLGTYKTTPEEDEKLLLSMLDYTLRHELVMLKATKVLSNRYSKKICIQDMEIKPKSKILGISSPSKPDFIIPQASAIGDIKTGTEFKDYFRITAAGYALAYENQLGKGHDINLGIIYFFPTRQRDISFAHLYIFVIDDPLRREFLDARDKALMVCDLQSPPPFAEKDKSCIYCKYLDECDKLRKRKKK